MFSFEREPGRRRFFIDASGGGALVAVRVPMNAKAVAAGEPDDRQNEKFVSTYRIPEFSKRARGANRKNDAYINNVLIDTTAQVGSLKSTARREVCFYRLFRRFSLSGRRSASSVPSEKIFKIFRLFFLSQASDSRSLPAVCKNAFETTRFLAKKSKFLKKFQLFRRRLQTARFFFRFFDKKFNFSPFATE